MPIEDDLKHYILQNLIRGSARHTASIGTDEPLIATGRLDSLGLMQLLSHIQQHWGIDLMNVAGPDDFVSIDTMADAIRRHVKG